MVDVSIVEDYFHLTNVYAKNVIMKIKGGNKIKRKYKKLSKWQDPFEEPVNVSDIKQKKVKDKTKLIMKEK